MRSWRDEATTELARLVHPDGGWPYRVGGAPATEATVLAGLALLASANEPNRGLVDRAADWLVAAQNPDGGVGILLTRRTPCWGTSHAALFWSAAQHAKAAQQRAVGWLLAHAGKVYPTSVDQAVQHDSTIPGWAWVDDTSAWVEPTALALLALRRAGMQSHPRAIQGHRLLIDRAIPSGGWNYGNKLAFGNELRPQLGPTGWALLALRGSAVPARVIDPALDYLLRAVEQVRAPQSLALGLLGLNAWKDRVLFRTQRSDRFANQDAWLAQSFDRCRNLADRVCLLAYLVLAGSPIGLAILGIADAASAAELVREPT